MKDSEPGGEAQRCRVQEVPLNGQELEHGVVREGRWIQENVNVLTNDHPLQTEARGPQADQ